MARTGYRRRRVMDAARVLPILGAFLFFLPLLWAGDSKTGMGVIYLFAVWAGLILAAFGLSRFLRHDLDGPDPPRDEDAG